MAAETQKRPGLLVTHREASEMLGVSKETLLRIRAAGALEYVWVPGLRRPRYRRADVERLVNGERAP